jgi:hypothetical protein
MSQPVMPMGMMPGMVMMPGMQMPMYNMQQGHMFNLQHGQLYNMQQAMGMGMPMSVGPMAYVPQGMYPFGYPMMMGQQQQHQPGAATWPAIAPGQGNVMNLADMSQGMGAPPQVNPQTPQAQPAPQLGTPMPQPSRPAPAASASKSSQRSASLPPSQGSMLSSAMSSPAGSETSITLRKPEDLAWGICDPHTVELMLRRKKKLAGHGDYRGAGPSHGVFGGPKSPPRPEDKKKGPQTAVQYTLPSESSANRSFVNRVRGAVQAGTYLLPTESSVSRVQYLQQQQNSAREGRTHIATDSKGLTTNGAGKASGKYDLTSALAQKLLAEAKRTMGAYKSTPAGLASLLQASLQRTTSSGNSNGNTNEPLFITKLVPRQAPAHLHLSSSASERQANGPGSFSRGSAAASVAIKRLRMLRKAIGSGTAIDLPGLLGQ